MVVNAPVSNILSAAEQTMALLLRRLETFPSSLGPEGRKCERSKWEGVELYGKTLGVVGLGKIGALVAQRASAFGMRLIAFDPFISEDRRVTWASSWSTSTRFSPKATSSRFTFPRRKRRRTSLTPRRWRDQAGVRIINVARGGIVNEADLADAIRNGHVQGAALDVFEKEPTTESPLFELPSVVVVPHLGASTFEAQDKAG